MNRHEVKDVAVRIERIREHIRTLEGERHPVASPEFLDRTADYIKSHLTMSGYEMSEQHVPHNVHRCRNIIATRHGVGQRQERIVVLAHYDTVVGSPGADDNASGVAVLLAIATELSHLRFERTIHFIAVTLEENAHINDPDTGTRGSRAMATHARENSWNIEGVVVLESVAYAGEDVVQAVPPGVPVPVPETGNFIALVGNERSRELVEGFARIIERGQIDLPHVSLIVPGNGDVLPDSRRSDHAPFWDEGYRAIMVTDTTNFRNPHYHRSSDTLETLNLEFAAKVCSVTAGLLIDMARPVL
jgi:Zn-dependent M28 family amino/carboxypeptidase